MQTAKQSATSPVRVGTSFVYDHTNSTIYGALGISLEEIEEINEVARVAFMKNESHTTSEALARIIEAYNQGELKTIDHLLLAVMFTGMNVGRMSAPSLHSLMGMLGED